MRRVTNSAARPSTTLIACPKRMSTSTPLSTPVARNRIAAATQSPASSMLSISMRKRSHGSRSWVQKRSARAWPRYTAARSGKTPEVRISMSGWSSSSQAPQSSAFQAS